MSPARIPEGARRGFIIPVGGAEKKTADSRILRRFVELCGGSEARIAIIPTASALVDTGARYERVFSELGAGSAKSLPIDERTDAGDPAFVAALDEASGIFITGGNQLRLSTILGGTDVARVIRRANAQGVHVMGTSAGAGFISEHMIAYGKEGSTPIAGMVTLAPGLGLTNRVVVDQHFRQRDRLGRLLTAISYNPFMVGLGLDEDTAAFMGPDDVIDVVGSGAVTLTDGSDIEHSSIGYIQPGKPVCITNIKLHVLVDGASYDLHRRKAVPPPQPAKEPD
jgi:cyanophycinase